jgi:hypothetical protein
MAQKREISEKNHMRIMFGAMLFGILFAMFGGAYVVPKIHSHLGLFGELLAIVFVAAIGVTPLAYYLKVYLPKYRPKT